MNRPKVIDADGHIYENHEEIEEYFDGKYRGMRRARAYPLFPSLICDGVLEKFPKLKIAFLEAGCGWLPYIMDRLDYEYETRGNRSFPHIRRKPSDYVKDCPVYVTCEPEETSLKHVIEVVGEDRVMFPSDYPHERVYGEFLKDIPELLKRPDLSDRAKQKILYDNAKEFYRI